MLQPGDIIKHPSYPNTMCAVVLEVTEVTEREDFISYRGICTQIGKTNPLRVRTHSRERNLWFQIWEWEGKDKPYITIQEYMKEINNMDIKIKELLQKYGK